MKEHILNIADPVEENNINQAIDPLDPLEDNTIDSLEI